MMHVQVGIRPAAAGRACWVCRRPATLEAPALHRFWVDRVPDPQNRWVSQDVSQQETVRLDRPGTLVPAFCGETHLREYYHFYHHIEVVPVDALAGEESTEEENG